MAISVLGPTAVDGTELPGRRERVVLSTLALTAPRAASMDRLADALWQEAPPASAPQVIQGGVARLRRRLPPDGIVATSDGYRLGHEARQGILRYPIRRILKSGHVSVLWATRAPPRLRPIEMATAGSGNGNNDKHSDLTGCCLPSNTPTD